VKGSSGGSSMLSVEILNFSASVGSKSEDCKGIRKGKFVEIQEES
jgi:hypothetical protein